MDSFEKRNNRKRDVVFLIAAASLPIISMLRLVNQYLLASLTGTLVYGFLIPGLLGIFLYKRAYRTNSVVKILCLYWSWLLLTRMINGDYVLVNSLDPMLSACQMIIVFMPGILLPKKECRYLLAVIAAIVCVFYLTLGVASVYVGITHRELVNPLDGYWICFVMKEMRIELLGLHPNIAGAHFLIAFCMAIYLLFRFRHPLIRLLALLAALVDVVVVAQTVSRNAQTCLSAAVGLVVGTSVIVRMHRSKTLHRFAAFCASALVCGVLFYQCFEPIRYGLWKANGSIEAQNVMAEQQPASSAVNRYADEAIVLVKSANSVMQPVAVLQSDTEESYIKDERSYLESGRKEIYWSALKSLQMEPKRLIVGSSWEHLMDYSHEVIREQVVHFHNDFLQVINLAGLPGLVLLLLFYFAMVKIGFLLLLRNGSQYTMDEKILAVPVAVFLIYSMLECVLTREYLDFRSLMFYLLCGFMTGTVNRKQCETGE